MTIKKPVKGKPRGRPFKKGNTISKGRQKPITEEERAIAKLTRTHLKIIIRKYLMLNKSELKNVALADETKVLDLMVISVMNKAIVQGDEKRINWFLEQLFGKLKEHREVQISGTIETKPAYKLKNLSDKDLIELKKLAEKAEAKE